MSKPVIIDGVVHRMRRGKLVAIPLEWLGQCTSRQTIKDRARARAERRTNTMQQGSHRGTYGKNIDKRKVRVEEET
jgi:hypothetical protein